MKTFLVLLLFPLTTLAQNLGQDDVRDRAFQMVKATVEFLATDAKTYGYPDKTTCSDCVSYPRLKAFIVEQKLTKADELVNETERWASAPATLSKEPATALNELRTQLINRITTGSERQHRRKLPSFSSYEAQMNQLAGLAPASTATQVAGLPQGQSAAPDATDDLQAAGSDTAYTDETVQPLSQTQSADNGWLSKSGLALLLSLVSLGLAGWLLLSRRKVDNGSKGIDSALDGQIAKLSDDLFRIKGDRNNAQETINRLQKRVEQLENQVSVLQKAVGVGAAASPVAAPPVQPTPKTQPMNVIQESASRQDSTPRPASPAPAPPVIPAENRPRNPPPAAASQMENRPAEAPPKPAPAPAAPKVLYARTVDLGDGFGADSLSEITTERPMIYQIQVLATGQATFRIADDPYAQRLALSDPYSYLNDACEYTSQPAQNSRIQTVKPGKLVLQGTKWLIQEKAQIAFG